MIQIQIQIQIFIRHKYVILYIKDGFTMEYFDNSTQYLNTIRNKLTQRIFEYLIRRFDRLFNRRRNESGPHIKA